MIRNDSSQCSRFDDLLAFPDDRNGCTICNFNRLMTLQRVNDGLGVLAEGYDVLPIVRPDGKIDTPGHECLTETCKISTASLCHHLTADGFQGVQSGRSVRSVR